MPRRKPDTVQEHRVTLGTWERDYIKSKYESEIVKNVGLGVGIGAVGIGGTYVAYKISKTVYEWGEDAVDWLSQTEETPEGNKTPPRWVRILLSLP